MGYRKMLLSVICSGAVLLAAAGTAMAAFWNLTGDIGVHDPAITKEGSAWYAFSTGQGIQVLKSDNGIHWYRVSQVFSSPLSWWKTYAPNMTTNDVWAPDVKTYNGRVWLYYSVSSFGKNTSAIGLASADSIGAGKWRDDGLVIKSDSSVDYNAIDPNLVIDASGNPWLAFGSWFSGIKITKLDKSTMKPTGSLYSIAKRSNGIEGAFIVYRNGYYYMFASIDKCCQGANSNYKIVVGRSTSITGPYTDKNGVDMMNGGGTVFDAGNSRWAGPGGQSIYNNNVIARHAYDKNDNGNPKLLINDLNWGADGWPTY